jgi:NodT family efflux transporter outer membrane factor (OMF) lipoprotein
LEGSYLTLTANIVTAVIREAGLRAQLKATADILRSIEKQPLLLEKQQFLGSISRADVLAQQSLLEQTKAGLPTIEKELAFTRHHLSVLTGNNPQGMKDLPSFDLGMIQLPDDFPKEIPATIVNQRPDVRAAEALLRSASAQVGVATANLYPQFILSGAYGPQSLRLSGLFDAENIVWNMGAGVLQPLFNGGALRAKRRAAMAAYDQSAAYFRSTVLMAYQNIADSLRALESDGLSLKAQGAALAAAREALDLRQDQFNSGAVNVMILLDARQQYQRVNIAFIQAQAARLADTAALFQALGGGWWKLKGEIK